MEVWCASRPWLAPGMPSRTWNQRMPTHGTEVGDSVQSRSPAAPPGKPAGGQQVAACGQAQRAWCTQVSLGRIFAVQPCTRCAAASVGTAHAGAAGSAQSRAGRPSGRACRQQRAQQAAGHAGQHKGERAAVAAGSADQAPQRAQRGRAQRLAAAVARGRLALRRLQARGYLLLWRIAAHVLM